MQRSGHVCICSDDIKTWSDPTLGDAWGIDPSFFHDPASHKIQLNLMTPNNNIERLWEIYQCEVELASGHCIGNYRSLWNGTMSRNSYSRLESPKIFLLLKVSLSFSQSQLPLVSLVKLQGGRTRLGTYRGNQGHCFWCRAYYDSQ